MNDTFNNIINRKSTIIFIFLLITQLRVCIFFGWQKEGLHVDEYFSYTLANSDREIFIHREQNFTEEWQDPELIYNYLSVEKGKGFHYDNVYYNQAGDAHPPLFYYALHTICSLSGGFFSKWQGLALNLILFTVIQIVMYCFTIRLFADKIYALLTVAFYGFCAGSISNVLYIRMYTMLTLFAVLFAFLLYMLLYSDNNCIYPAIFMVSVCGFLTQYYFYIYAFFISAIFCIIQLFKKKIPVILKYAITVFSAIATAIWYYTYTLKHIFSGYRGKEALTNFTDKPFLNDFYGYITKLNSQTGIFIVLLAIVALFTVALKNNKKTNKICIGPEGQICIVLAIASVRFIAVISKVAPSVTDRYIFCIYPMLVIIVCFALSKIAEMFKTNQITGVISVILLVAIMFSYIEGPGYLYIGYEDKIDTIKSYNTSAVYIIENKWKLNGVLLPLASADRFRVTDTAHSNLVAEEVISGGYKDILLYISNDYPDCNETAGKFTERMKFEKCDYLFDDRYCSIYYCQK